MINIITEFLLIESLCFVIELYVIALSVFYDNFMVTLTEQEPCVYRQFPRCEKLFKKCAKNRAASRVRSREDCFSDPSYLWEIGSAPLLTFILSQGPTTRK